MELVDLLRASGGFATRSSLLEAGATPWQLRRGLSSGAVITPRYGWYAAPDADPDSLAAVGAGGRLACSSALRKHGIWVLADRRLHVSCPPGKGERRPDLRVHTGAITSVGLRTVVESPLEALERFARCGSRRAFIAAADSAINRGAITYPMLRSVIATSAATRRLMDQVDGRSESGTETLARLALRSCNVRLRPQVVLAGVGRVDLLVGDRLIVEMDSWSWHSTRDAFENDRRRDLAAAARGYQTARITYERALNDWPNVQRDLLDLVRAGAHLRSGSSRRLARNHGL